MYGMLGLLGKGAGAYGAYRGMQQQPRPGQEAIQQTQMAQQQQASQMMNDIMNGQGPSQQFANQQQQLGQQPQGQVGPGTFVNAGGVPIDYVPDGYSYGDQPMVLPDLGGGSEQQDFIPGDFNSAMSGSGFNGGSDGGYMGQQGRQNGGTMSGSEATPQGMTNQIRQAGADTPSGFLNLTGSMQDPNAFLRMSQGYTSGGLLGALGMLLTKNQQQPRNYYE